MTLEVKPVQSCFHCSAVSYGHWVVQKLFVVQSDLPKQSLVGGLDILPLGVAASNNQLQDGFLVGPYGNKHHGHVCERHGTQREYCVEHSNRHPGQRMSVLRVGVTSLLET